jgi:hypothetical protein
MLSIYGHGFKNIQDNGVFADGHQMSTTNGGAQLNGASQTIRHLTAFTAPPCLDSRGSERLISRLAVLIVAG